MLKLPARPDASRVTWSLLNSRGLREAGREEVESYPCAYGTDRFIINHTHILITDSAACIAPEVMFTRDSSNHRTDASQ